MLRIWSFRLGPGASTTVEASFVDDGAHWIVTMKDRGPGIDVTLGRKWRHQKTQWEQKCIVWVCMLNVDSEIFGINAEIWVLSLQYCMVTSDRRTWFMDVYLLLFILGRQCSWQTMGSTNSSMKLGKVSMARRPSVKAKLSYNFTSAMVMRPLQTLRPLDKWGKETRFYGYEAEHLFGMGLFSIWLI